VRDSLRSKKSQEIQGMFGRIAHRYDLLNRVLSVGQDTVWRRRLARRVAAAEPRLVMDVCTGTGDVALSFDRALSTIGTDFCLPMLARARTKVVADGRALPLFAGDALALPVTDGVVDVVTVSFGVRNFEDLERGLSELVRVLRPGGTLLVLEFSTPRGPLGPLLRWWVQTVPPRIGRFISGDAEAYSYLPDSVRRFPDGDAMLEVLRRVGLESCRVRRLTGGVASLYEGIRPSEEREKP
jgi:demethylmenaquinone methyltransferase/2-methoxy-6-polyprenyl-1,4-benzoquinol methylase